MSACKHKFPRTVSNDDIATSSTLLAQPHPLLVELWSTMADTGSSDLSPLPEEMLKLILDSSHNLLHSPRLGQLLSYGRPPIHTPHYVAATSRGVVPHLSQDVFQKHTDIRAVYMGLEDCKSFPQSCQRTADFLSTVDVDTG